MATQSLILSAFSIVLPHASISSSRLSRALLTTFFPLSSSSLSESESSPRMKRDFFFGLSLSSSPLISLSSSSSSLSDSSLLSESPGLRMKRDIGGFPAAGLGAAAAPSSSLDKSSSSEELSLSLSESPACLKNRDMVCGLPAVWAVWFSLGWGVRGTL